MQKIFLWAVFAVSMVLGGCATGRNYQTDIDALNARISALQSQLAEKDQEVSKLQGQVNGQASSVAQLESEKRMLSEKLDRAAADLEASKAKSAKAAKVSKPADDSDLK